MIKGNIMGVIKQIVQAYDQAEDDILNIISEVIVEPSDFHPSAYAIRVTNAMKCNNSFSD